MVLHRFALAALITLSSTVAGGAQTAETTPEALSVELNALRDVDGACRLSFMAHNETGATIERVVFETVVFDQSGGVVSLSLFDFRDLPVDRPRVRQFDLQGMTCDTLGKALINGASTCLVAGAENPVCEGALRLTSRLDVELLG